jgi:hypothetical protein
VHAPRAATERSRPGGHPWCPDAGAIVAAGAVVLRDVPPRTYAEGNPARVISRLGWANR